MKTRIEHCSFCGGTEFVDAVDNHGEAYRGCGRCIILPVDFKRVSGSYEVEVLDQVNEGLEVWVGVDDEFDDQLSAEEFAAKKALGNEYGKARVVRVIRQVVTTYRKGVQ